MKTPHYQFPNFRKISQKFFFTSPVSHINGGSFFIKISINIFYHTYFRVGIVPPFHDILTGGGEGGYVGVRGGRVYAPPLGGGVNDILRIALPVRLRIYINVIIYNINIFIYNESRR